MLEVQDIMKKYGEEYRKKHKLMAYKLSAMIAIERCRTAELGAQIGFMEVLHTWGQTLVYHPHIHCIVPAGGIDKLGKWRNSKKNFFIPVKVLSRKFRGKFLYYLKQEKLDFYGENAYLKVQQNFDELKSRLYKKEWVSYCKPVCKFFINIFRAWSSIHNTTLYSI